MNGEYKDTFAGVIAEYYAKQYIAIHFGVLASKIFHDPGSSRDKDLKIDFHMIAKSYGDMMIDLKSSIEYGSSVCIDEEHPIFDSTSIAHGDRWIGCLFSKSLILYLIRASEELKSIANLKRGNGKDYYVVRESDVKRLPKTLVEEINIDVPFGKFFETTFGKDKPWTRCKSKAEAIGLAKAFGEQLCTDIPS